MIEEVVWSSAFKRDYRRECKKDRQSAFLIQTVVFLLAGDEPLAPQYRDHALSGNWKPFRDCHIKPDLVLIYQKIDAKLYLVRLGSHSELGL